jgi:hypothetical protein
VTRLEWVLAGAAAVGLGCLGLVQFHGGAQLAADGATAKVKVGIGKAMASVPRPGLRDGLADVTSAQETPNRWTAPAWSLASVGAAPLRMNHPLFRRPPYIGSNRHKVQCDGWNGWYYDAPENEMI